MKHLFASLIFLLIGYALCAQPKTMGFVKVGGAMNGVQSAFLSFSGGGGNLVSCDYEVVSQNDGLKYLTPFASVGIQSLKANFFGLAGALSYAQYVQAFSYTGYTVTGWDFPYSQTYTYAGNTGKGTVKSHIGRLELSAFFRYKGSRLHLGTNLDVVFPEKVNLKVHHEEYEAHWHSGMDSVTMISSSETTITLDKHYFNYPYNNIRDQPNLSQIIVMSFWTSLEQDFRIKNTFWFGGIQGLYSPMLKYYSLSCYLGFYFQQKKLKDEGWWQE